MHSYNLRVAVYEMYEPRASLKESEPVNESETAAHMRMTNNDDYLLGASKKMTKYTAQNKKYYSSFKHK